MNQNGNGRVAWKGISEFQVNYSKGYKTSKHLNNDDGNGYDDDDDDEED